MPLIIVPLVILALIAAIWGQKTAQGCFHSIALPISLIVIAAVTVAWPPGGLIGIGVFGFIVFCSWAQKASIVKAEREAEQARLQQSMKMANGIAQMKGMLNVVNQAAAMTQQGQPPPPVASATPPGQRTGVVSRPNQFCIQCGAKHAADQRFCADCGAALMSS